MDTRISSPWNQDSNMDMFSMSFLLLHQWRKIYRQSYWIIYKQVFSCYVY